MTSNEMALVALILSRCISSEQFVGPADWADVYEVNDMQDLQLGSGNNYWLRRCESGEHQLRVQARSLELNQFQSGVAEAMFRAVKKIEAGAGIKVLLPWDESAVIEARRKFGT